MRTDIEDFFANVDHQLLQTALAGRLPDPEAVGLAIDWAAAPLFEENGTAPRDRGLPEGAAVSPLLAEVYLYGFDRAIHRVHGHLVRYADDISVFCHTADQAVVAATAVTTHLEGLQLSLNEAKTCIASFDYGFDLLNWHFQNDTAVPNSEKERRP